MEEEALGKAYDTRLLRRLARYLKPYQRLVAMSVSMLMAHSLVQTAGPYLTKVAIDKYLNPQRARSPLDAYLSPDRFTGLSQIVGLYLGILLLGFVFQYLQTYLMQYTGQKVMFDLRRDIFDQLQRLDISYYDHAPVGRLVTRVTTDVDVLNELFAAGLVAIFGDLLSLAFIGAAMLSLSPSLTLAALTVSPLVVGVTVLFRRAARDANRRIRVAIARINADLQEHVTGMAVVQLFNHEAKSAERFERINADHRDAYKDAILAHSLFYPAIEWLGTLAMAVLLIYGGYRVLGGGLTIGIVVAFMQYALRIFRPIQDLGEKYNILQSAMASAERIFKLLDTPVRIQGPGREPAPVPAVAAGSDGMGAAAPGLPVAAVSANGHGRIEFQNVWFAYQGEDWVLQDVSFAVEPDETLALVGHTGAGKTSILSLLLRFYDATRGRILVGGVDVREYAPVELRRKFGVVLQDPYLFTGTIADNIRLGTETIPDERIEEAAEEVNLAEFIRSLPGGFDEEVRERGSSLSTGQKQLINFARALAHEPQFLILDEATSSVDTETEFRVREALSRMVTGRTSIIVAHRLSTIQRADRILVMHKGRLRESGTHQELLARRGIYWKLYQLQYKEQEAIS
ncbi:MAG TPA: ABC transporter ATP-binding protein [Bryobacterales bacterium]|nr:ABC transporter ATP-binding protein [Bryobacterales bacterium]